MSAIALFPKLHPTHIKQLKAALNHPPFRGAIYLHGDGNMYPEYVVVEGKVIKNTNSDDRAIFHNNHPANTPAEYRVLFTKTSRIPADLDELADMLMEAHQTELLNKVDEENVSGPQSMAFKVEDEPKVSVPAPAAAPAAAIPPAEPLIPEPIPTPFKVEEEVPAPAAAIPAEIPASPAKPAAKAAAAPAAETK